MITVITSNNVPASALLASDLFTSGGLAPSGPIRMAFPEERLPPAFHAGQAEKVIGLHEMGGDVRVVTYSEVFILRVMRRIREGKLKVQDVAIYVFVILPWGDTPVPILVTLHEDGDFLDWPDGFFEEGFRERFATAEEDE